MGKDKGLLNYHGMPQRDFLFNLVNSYCEKVFFSVRSDQKNELDNKPFIVDQNKYRGPFNGILSAHNQYSKVAWLVLACDLPLLNKETLSLLVRSRDVTKKATALATKETNLPEPLISIWEPSGLSSAVIHMETSESSCARKFLINSDIKIIYPKEDKLLYNANSIDEYKTAKSIIN
ncbi:MAG: molybdenum cofactor guanylyltransferase [Flavobacteriaceae bacterium]|nr:molybdenum cofactor guanylyltransferase [Flavobacteriaceae bacterium]